MRRLFAIALLRRHLSWSLAAALGLAACQTILLVRTAWDKADTKDEPHNLASSTVQWLHPYRMQNCDAPILPKWGFALALRLRDATLFEETSTRGRHPLWSRRTEDSRLNLFAARMTTIILTVLAGLALWRVGRRFGIGAGIVTHALWCFSPVVLANGSLASLDGWTADLLSFALLGAVRHWERPNVARACLIGIPLGLAAASKVTALGAAPIALVVAMTAAAVTARSRHRSALRPVVATTLLVVLCAFVTLWGVYGFSVGKVAIDDPCGRADGAADGPLIGPLPFPKWIGGLVRQWRHGQSGHLSYLFGQTSSGGWWWFYLAALALKTTIGAQLLAAAGIIAAIILRPSRQSLLIDAALLAFPLGLITAMSAGHTQNGIRYILPAFPFFVVLGGRAFLYARQAFGRAGLWIIVLALLGGIVESIAVHPHHLMFFNLWAGGPEGGPRYLIHGDDWGQDQRRLAAWQQSKHPWRLFYTPYTEKPEHWGMLFEEPPCEPRPGYYALQAIEVHRPKRIAPGCLDWLTVEPPDARFGYSIYLYLVTKARIERLIIERRTKQPFWRSGPSLR